MRAELSRAGCCGPRGAHRCTQRNASAVQESQTGPRLWAGVSAPPGDGRDKPADDPKTAAYMHGLAVQLALIDICRAFHC